MAFLKNNSSAARSTDTSWKALAYLNLSLPGTAGLVKLGGMPLAGNNPDHVALVGAITADITVLDKVRSKLTVVYQPLKSITGGFTIAKAYASKVSAEPSFKDSAFLNFYLPSSTGPTKLGFVELKRANANDAMLIAMLEAEPAAVEQLLKDLSVTFQPIVAKASSGYNLD